MNAAGSTPIAGSPIELCDALAAKGDARERRPALRIAGAGLAACDVARATRLAVTLEGDELIVDGKRHRLDPTGRLIVVGAGKASLAIGGELERILGDRLDAGLIVVRGVQDGPLDRIEVLAADHPLPSARSVIAARRLLELATGAGDRDIVIACFTGGSSALASLPPESVSEAEKHTLHELLLASGIGIVEVNTVRKHVSAFKGGRLAAAALPARLINLTVSDVAGDHIDAITDPSVADSSRAADAIAILYGHGLWEDTPRAIRDHLQSPVAESPSLERAEIQTVLLVTGTTACDAMALEATSLGLTPVVVSTTLEGEARQVGKLLANLARQSSLHGAPFAPGSVLVGCGGESTVTLSRSSNFGEGGPNQEAAIAAALELEGLPVAAVFLDTDGSDGGTGHAGAIVDGQTVSRAAGSGIDLRGALLDHRSQVALAALEDALITGPTGTNVNDLFAIVVGGRTVSALPMIVVDRLVKDFGEVRAVDDVTLEIAAGEFFSMLGPSGCGKTTTLRVIAGFEDPDHGRVLLDGKDVTFVSPKKRNVNMVFQDYALFPHMTVAENAAFGLKLKHVDKTEIRSRVAEMLTVVRLDGYEDRRPAELSGGQRQRVALARALVNRPAALLLDEPLGALDLKLRREMQLELKRIQKSTGTTFVYVTHDQEEALTMSDRIAVMEGGVVQQVDEPKALYERPETAFVADFIGTSNTLVLSGARSGGGLTVMELGDGMRIVAPDPGRNGECRITVRPEKIRIGGEPSAEGSRVTGTVVERVYLGSLSQTVVEIVTGERLIVHELNDDERPPPEPGAEVVLTWQTRHSLVLSDEGGRG